MRKRINVIRALLMVSLFSLLLIGCGTGPKEKNSNDQMTINKIYVDNSYKSDKSDVLKAVYVHYTINSKSNIDVNSYTLQMLVGENSYDAEQSAPASNLAAKVPNLIFTQSTTTSVYAGETRDVLASFLVPEADLEEGKLITFKGNGGLDAEGIQVKTDDIVHVASPDELAQTVDPDGYAEHMANYNPADEATADAVSSKLNGNYYWFSSNGLSGKYEFSAPNNYTLTSLGITVSGTYKVLHGYIELTLDSTGYKSYAPYTLDETGGLDVDFASATMDGNQP